MSLIRRNTTRTIKNATETTRQTDTPSDDSVPFNLETTDKFYIGFKKPFASRYFHFSHLNETTLAIAVKYWNGSSFVPVEDLIDQTVGFTQNGFISWVNPGDWKAKAQAPASDVELYWVELTVSDNMTDESALQAVLNLFCDDTLLRAHYPELVSDERWLPEGRTDFLEQYVAAKDLVILRLKKDKIIRDENQIVDVNEVALAATHAAAYIIMYPISRSEDDRESVAACLDAMNKALNLVPLDLDVNDDGKIDAAEENIGQIFRARG